MSAPYIVIAGLAGLIVGSFLNVVAYRLPRGESLVHPGSRCPGCGVAVARRDNIPVFGWLLLQGRCRSCAMRIPIRYPAVEALTGALFAAVVATQDDTLRIILGLLLVSLLVPLTLIDLDVRRLPDALTLPGAIAALVAGIVFEPSFVPEQLIAGAAAFVFFFVAASLYRGGMGMGDVKLAGMLGVFLGRAVAPAVLIALLSGVLVGIAIILRVGVSEGRRTAVPFGPFLALGGLVGFFVGDQLMNAYSDRL
ncbi:unannotated protein [freshwater metagenome]|uniref:Unannotated protein n=1 Tax=freshwater metagenome TaxID=449393 RepID=A0A6J7EGD8_9ZZZZ|nr:prepilin peptidase [Actinomycetota bacterium]